MPASQSDILLMQRIAARDEDAFTILMNNYTASVIRFAEKILNSLSSAEEVAQEVFLKIWKVADSWEPTASLKTWIYKITLNRCLDIKRRIKYKLTIFEPSIIEKAVSEKPKEENDGLQLVLKKLSLDEKAAITLHYYEEYSQREAAEILGISLRTFERRIASALVLLRCELKRMNIDVTDIL